MSSALIMPASIFFVTRKPGMVFFALIFSCIISIESLAGAYIFSGEGSENNIAHPGGYSGAGGIVTVRVCISPSSPNASEMEIPVQNIINIYNQLQPTTGNLVSGGANNIPASQIDFESVALHEVGHCLGMAHVNAASESGLTGSDQDYTKATDGPNNTFDLNPGADGVIGSSDDLRGDDGNLHWYRRTNNNPFTIDNPVDSTTYARGLADLQALGHSFAANADRAVAGLLGVPNTEAVMQQLTYFDEAQRTLVHDDVATILYAASGVDELSGTSDDYTVVLKYEGISDTNCDINMSITNTSSLAFCSVNGSFLATDHFRITNPSIEFGSGFSWFFNTQTVNQAPILGMIGNQAVDEGQSISVGITAVDPDGNAIQFSSTGLPAFASLTDNGNGTASLAISPAEGDAGSYPVSINVTDNGLPVLSDSESFNIIVSVPVIDTDGDGIPDNIDTDDDNDGLLDIYETNTGLFVSPTDTGTNSLIADTDGDGVSDGIEVAAGTDPLLNTSTPVLYDGDANGDGSVNTADLLLAIRILSGLHIPDLAELAHLDVAPLLGGTPSPDGQVNVGDYVVLVRKVSGVISF